MRNRGRKVEVDMAEGTIEGWMYGEVPTGLYIALDTDAKNIRFIREGQYTRVYYPREGVIARFVAQEPSNLVQAVDQLASQLAEPMAAALDRVDHNRVKRLGSAIQGTRAELQAIGSLRGQVPLPPSMDMTNVYESLVRARNTHVNVLDELERSGIAQILRQHQTAIKQVVSESTLPQVDAQVVSPSELQNLIQAAQGEPLPANTDFGRQLSNQPINVTIGSVAIGTVNIGTTTPPQENQEDVQSGFWRTVGGWGKVLLGSGLVVANMGAGVSVGLVMIATTLGLGTVPVAVALATSIYTGAKGTVDALTEMHEKDEK